MHNALHFEITDELYDSLDGKTLAFNFRVIWDLGAFIWKLSGALIVAKAYLGNCKEILNEDVRSEEGETLMFDQLIC
jgi:hypothetical protein